MSDKDYLKVSFDLARESLDQGGFPAGAIVVKDGEIISKGISIGYLIHDPTSHAEAAAIREACKILQTSDLKGATVYENLESCVMCFSVAYWAGITRIISGARKTNSLVKNGVYEGVTHIKDFNQENNRKIELSFISDFEKESLGLVEEWLKKNNF